VSRVEAIPPHRAAGIPYRSDIQGLRGVAVLLVVLYHAGGIVPGGYLGVDVFFVLSGFLIGGLLVQEFSVTGRIRLSAFFARRVRRLLPALSAMTSLTLVLSVLFLDAWASLPQAVATGVGASLFAANVQLYLAGDYFAPAAELNPLLHTWSLSVEEQFYVGLPILLVLVIRLRHGRTSVRPFLGTVLVALTLSLWLALVLSSPGRDEFLFLAETQRFAFYNPFARAWQFLAGVALALMIRESMPSPESESAEAQHRRAPVLDVRVLGLMAIIGTSLVIDGTTRWPGPATLIPTFGTVAVIAGAGSAATGRASNAVDRILTSRPLVKVGDLSYSWYLWHWPAIVLAREAGWSSAASLMFAAVVALAPAWWSYRFVEERFRRDRTISGGRVLRLATLSISIPLLLALAAGATGDRARAVAAAAGTLNSLLADEARVAAAAIEEASLGAGPWDVVIVGDSHAGALGQGMAVMLSQLDPPVTFGMKVRPGCLFLSGVTSDIGCGPWQDEVLADLVAEDVGTVIIAGFATGRISGERRGDRSQVDLFDARGRRFDDSSGALDAYSAALDRVVERLTRAGRRVVIVGPVPDFPTDLTSGISAVQALLGIDADEVLARPIPASAARQRSEPFLAAALAVAARHPNATVVDPIPVLCPTECRQIVDGVPLYRDHDHLSLAGALLLARAVLEVIQ
jgi:peptidoglycan/LPS O-acetylase OafA/YrhL